MSKSTLSSLTPARAVHRFAFRMLAVFGPAHLYVGLRLIPDLPGGPTVIALAASYGVLSLLFIPFGTLAHLYAPRSLIDPLVWVGTLAMGWFSSLFVLTLARDLALLIPATRAWTSQSALVVIALSLLITALGFINARKVARVVRVSVPIEALPHALEGFTIAQLSDIHVGSTIKAGTVRGMVARTNELQADMIAITGDVVDGDVETLAKDVAPLSDLRSRHGTFIVTGNHEFYSGADPWMKAFAKMGMHPLRNGHVLLNHNGADLVVAGIEDFSASHHDPARQSDPVKALEGAPDGPPRILLAHQPRSAKAVHTVGVDLQLSGHTHGGQIWPWTYFVRLQQPWTAGLHRLDRMWIYVSRGTGYWGPPNRFGAPSEITLLTLTKQA